LKSGRAGNGAALFHRWFLAATVSLASVHRLAWRIGHCACKAC